MKQRARSLGQLTALALALVADIGLAASTSTAATSSYSLLPESRFQDDCLICARPVIPLPLRGGFRLRLTNADPLFTWYAVEDLQMTGGSEPGAIYKLTGSGYYKVGGEVAILQEAFLELWVDDGSVRKLCQFTNSNRFPDRSWPMLHLAMTQTNGTLLHTYSMNVFAAPFKELWFSTASGFHPGIWPATAEPVSGGDLVSSSGTVIRRNEQLSAHLGIMPGVPDLGLDAVDVLPGGEIVFSIPTGIFSEMLGFLTDGDILSEKGRVVWSEKTLMAAFSPLASSVAPGLDALQVISPSEVYFSIRSDVFSQKLGRTLRHGDLLSSRGTVVKLNEELLAAFHPAEPKKDYGLDAVHVWPGGEVWFSLEEGFYDQNFQSYHHGDILSSGGYVVYRNLDLLNVFQPLEDLADFGLDALFVVTDPLPDAQVPASQCMAVTLQPQSNTLRLQWQPTGRLFQLETAPRIQGPWSPASSITDSPIFEIPFPTLSPAAYYRLQQW